MSSATDKLYEANEAKERLWRERNEALDALQGLVAQLHTHIKLDVKKHYSLLVADSVAQGVLAKLKS